MRLKDHWKIIVSVFVIIVLVATVAEISVLYTPTRVEYSGPNTTFTANSPFNGSYKYFGFEISFVTPYSLDNLEVMTGNFTSNTSGCLVYLLNSEQEFDWAVNTSTQYWFEFQGINSTTRAPGLYTFTTQTNAVPSSWMDNVSVTGNFNTSWNLLASSHYALVVIINTHISNYLSFVLKSNFYGYVHLHNY